MLANHTLNLYAVLIALSTKLSKFSDAKGYLDIFRERYVAAGKPQLRLSYSLRVEALYYGALGAHTKSAELYEQSWQAASSTGKTRPLAQQMHAISKGAELIFAGHYVEANKTLSFYDFSKLEPSRNHERWIALDVFAKTMSYQQNVSLAEFDFLEASFGKTIGSTDALLYYIARTVVYQRQGHKAGSRDDLRKAVASGRLFAKSLKYVRDAGQHKDSWIPDSVLSLAKEAYLLAIYSLLGTETDINELLEAINLMHESSLDKDIGAAAVRRNSIDRITPLNLRTLQDEKWLRKTEQCDK